MQPRLINPIFIEIVQIDEDKTSFSNERREPSNYVKRKVTFKIKAQIFFSENEYAEAVVSQANKRNLGGAILNSKGYIVVRNIDLQKLGKVLSVGDKLVSYGNVGKETSCEFYLIGKKDAAHYADIGTTTLQKWFFEDRK